MSKSQDRTGKAGQNYAASALSILGIRMVEKIGTPVKLIPSRFPGLFGVRFEEKVSGDHRGILPGGRGVLAETKTILNRNLTYSDLRVHQPARLSEHAELGGLSLLVWVRAPHEIYVMEWPIDGFGPGKGITPERAAEICRKESFDAEKIEV
jgi:hypothetical protein